MSIRADPLVRPDEPVAASGTTPPAPAGPSRNALAAAASDRPATANHFRIGVPDAANEQADRAELALLGIGGDMVTHPARQRCDQLRGLLGCGPYRFLGRTASHNRIATIPSA